MSADYVWFWKSIHAFKKHVRLLYGHTMLYVGTKCKIKETWSAKIKEIGSWTKELITFCPFSPFSRGLKSFQICGQACRLELRLWAWRDMHGLTHRRKQWGRPWHKTIFLILANWTLGVPRILQTVSHSRGYSGLVVTGVWGPSLEPHTHLQEWFWGKVVPMARDFLQKVDPCLGISCNKWTLYQGFIYLRYRSTKSSFQKASVLHRAYFYSSLAY